MENVSLEKPVQKDKEKKKDKRTMMDVMRRKTHKETEQVIAPSKKKIPE